MASAVARKPAAVAEDAPLALNVPDPDTEQ